MHLHIAIASNTSVYEIKHVNCLIYDVYQKSLKLQDVFLYHYRRRRHALYSGCYLDTSSCDQDVS